MMTQEQLDKQDAVFQELKDEFARLQKQEENLRKHLGSSNEDAKIEDLPPEFRKHLDEAAAKAKREGAARAEQFRSGVTTTTSSTAKMPGGHRRNVVRI